MTARRASVERLKLVEATKYGYLYHGNLVMEFSPVLFGNKKFASKGPLSPSLRELFMQMLSDKKEVISDSYYKGMRLTYDKYLQPELGNKPIDKITISNVQQIVNNMLKAGKKPATARKIFDILNPIFKRAVKDKLVDSNIMEDVKFPKFDNKKYFEIATEDAQRLYKAIMKQKDIQTKALFLMLLSGRRLNEVLTLEWSDINFQNNTYKIKSENNKNRRNQVYPLLPFISAILLKLPKYGKLVFAKPDGASIGYPRRQWDEIRQTSKSEDISKMTIHSMRNLLGHISVNNGISLEQIGKALGHSSTSITQRYSEVSRKSVENVQNKLFEVLAKR